MRQIDLSRYSDVLKLDAGSGFHISSQAGGEVSYPENGLKNLALIEDNSFWYGHRNQCVIRAVRNHPPNGPIFDVGGGNGFVASALQRDGHEVVLVEPFSSGCARARKRGITTVVMADWSTAQFRSGSLPAVGLFDVVEHSENDVAFLTGIREALAPGGKLFITVPAYQWLWSEVDEFSGHFRRYTMPMLNSAAEKAELSLCFGTYIFQALVPAILCSRVLMRSREGLAPLREGQQTSHSRTASARFLERAMRYEWTAIDHRVSLPFGASLLAVYTRNER